ncbi:S-adenosylmethionine decarboxylase family protein [Magnetofaba australis]|uniref:Putative adenosylmethionine decarboxylase n=1 Tax=Magnetofaba australis IT-1 TaxID=1434232 RepID=A0A1Y2K9H7_9PROT|nr:S-adenosylmethionine decarboxylase [Magnetofaba australis]OSM07147.1 putative adenosylmethionine decarboxylase [Magnetofaba australis IT-1]
MEITQLIIDAYGCQGPLNDAEPILDAMTRAAERVGAHSIGQAQARYVPHGITAILFLAESHILVSTWPEHQLAMVDLLLCNPDMDPYAAWAELEALLKPVSEARINETLRRVALEPGTS